MTVWIVLVTIAAALALISLIRIGGAVEYSRSGVLVCIRAGAIKFRVYPPAPRKKSGEKKPEKTKNPKKDRTSPAEQKEKAGGQLSDLKVALPLVAEAAGHLRRKVRVDRLLLDVTAAASDPAAAAVAFGGGNAAIGMIWPLLENNFNIGDRRIRTWVDFDLTEPEVFLYASFSMQLGQAIALALGLGIRFLKLRSGQDREQTKKEAV